MASREPRLSSRAGGAAPVGAGQARPARHPAPGATPLLSYRGPGGGTGPR